MNAPLTLAGALASLPEAPRKLKPLVPSYLDPASWRPGGMQQPAGWAALRASILARDGGCVYCGHMPQIGDRDVLEVNHLGGYRDNRPEALETVCVLCHRVLHAGRSAAIYGSLLLFRHAAVDQHTLIRLCWHLRRTARLADRPLMDLLGLRDQAPFRMDRAYLAGLRGYVVQRYWLLERGSRPGNTAR